MKIFILISLLFGISGFAGYFSTPVEMVELNHFYDRNGRLVYDQVIFWGKDVKTGKFQVRCWCMCGEFYPLTVNGVTKFENEDYRVHSKMFRESWSHKDPERENKIDCPESMRIAVPKKSPFLKKLPDDNNQTSGQ